MLAGQGVPLPTRRTHTWHCGSLPHSLAIPQHPPSTHWEQAAVLTVSPQVVVEPPEEDAGVHVKFVQTGAPGGQFALSVHSTQ